MSRLVTVSRAAKLAGVSRGAVQKHIQDGEIESFEGMVRLQDVIDYFPVANDKTDNIIEKLERFINNAAVRARNPKLTIAPDVQTMAARVSILTDELIESKLELSIFYNIVDKLKTRLTHLGEEHPQAVGSIRELISWLLGEVDAIADRKFSQFPILATDTFLRIMAAQVTVTPSGHEFLVDGSNSILESGLSSSLALNYGCSNGNCGKCKARVISGEVKKIRHHDYVLSEKEKLQGYILTCSNTAVTDLVLEAEEANNELDIPKQTILAWIRKVIPLNNNVSSLSIKTPRTQRLRFFAGQTVRLDIAGVGGKTLHIASCPCDDMNLQFHFDSGASDPFTRYLVEQAKPNDTITINGPSGHFILQEDKPNPIVFVAFGLGFAPIKSLIEHALTWDVTERIQLYRAASTNDDLYLSNLCRAWADAFEHFDYHPVCYGENEPGQAILVELQKNNTNFTGQHFYISGNDEQIAQTKNALLAQGIDEETLVSDTVAG